MAKKKLTKTVLASIRVDREERGHTITQIMANHNLSSGTASKAIQGMDSSNVKRASPSRRVVTPVARKPRPPLTSTDLGEAVRKMAVGQMLLAGLNPFLPAKESTSIDILVLRDDGGVLKCQCKWIRPHKNGSHIFPLTCLHPGPGVQRVRHVYTSKEVDYFIGYCDDNESFYVVPWSIGGGRSELRVWVLREPLGTNGSEGFNAEPYRNAFHLMSQ